MRFLIIVGSTPGFEAATRPARDAEGRRVVDGPFTEAQDLIAGYTVIAVRSRDEALPWSRRFPNPLGEGREAAIKVRQRCEPHSLPMQHTEDTP